MTEVIRPDSVVVTAQDHHVHFNHAPLGANPWTDRGVVDAERSAAQRSAFTDSICHNTNQTILLQGQRYSDLLAAMNTGICDKIAAQSMEMMRLSTQQMLAAKECCCEIQKTVVAEGQRNREWQQQQLVDDLRARIARSLPVPAPPI